jgi:hypothetical protein
VRVVLQVCSGTRGRVARLRNLAEVALAPAGTTLATTQVR